MEASKISTPRNLRTTIAMALAVAVCPTTVLSQQGEQLEEVFVTGSRIKRYELEAASPVAMISSEQISQTGATDLGQVMKQLPSVTGSPRSQHGAGGFNDGSVQIRLRGLDARNTLVLINGRRSVQRGTGSSVDLASVPLATIERIEVLKDGASAVYGSDAVAGVVNVILKREFDGLMLEGEIGESSQGDGRRESASLTWGGQFADQRGRALVSATYQNEAAIYRRDRDISSDADLRRFGGSNLRSGRAPATRIRAADSADAALLASIASGNLTARSQYGLAAGSNLGNGLTVGDLQNAFRTWTYETPEPCNISQACDGFDYHDYETQSNDHKTNGLWVSGDYDLGGNNRLFAELGFTTVDSTGIFAPAAIEFSELVDGRRNIVSADSIYNPFGVDVNVQRRVTENGIVRPTHNEGTTQRFVFGLEGALFTSGWDYSVAFNLQDADNLVSRGSQMSVERVRQAIGPSFIETGANGAQVFRCGTPGNVIFGCVPLNLIGPVGSIDPSMIDWIFVNKPTERSTNKLRAMNADFTGPLFDMPGGTAQLAIGAEYREEDASIVLDRATNIGDVAFVEAQEDTLAPTREIKEVYSEVLLPVLSTVDVEAAVRWSDYNDFGSSTNPKIGLKYRPVESMLFRGTYSEAFRAPTFGELYAGRAFAFVNFEDPCESGTQTQLPGCPSGSPLPPNLGFSQRTGGTRSLQAEEAESYTLGLVYTPSTELSLTADYWNIKQSNVVGTIGVQVKMDDVARNGAASPFFADVVRDPVSGELLYVDDTLQNIDQREIAGWDLAARYSLRDTAWGEFLFGIDLSHMTRWRDNNDDDEVGTWSDRFALPENRVVGQIAWEYGAWGASANIQYIDSMQNVEAGDGIIDHVDSYTRTDAQVSYTTDRFGKEMRVVLGVLNLFDQDPPIVGTTVDGGTDPTTYDPTGMYPYLRISQRF